jgi:hypothetical protein
VTDSATLAEIRARAAEIRQAPVSAVFSVTPSDVRAKNCGRRKATRCARIDRLSQRISRNVAVVYSRACGIAAPKSSGISKERSLIAASPRARHAGGARRHCSTPTISCTPITFTRSGTTARRTSCSCVRIITRSRINSAVSGKSTASGAIADRSNGGIYSNRLPAWKSSPSVSRNGIARWGGE